MKKIIRYLCDVSGVSVEIRNETYVEVGHILMNDRNWFSGDNRVKIYNAFTLYAMRFIHKHNGPNVSVYRDKLDEMGESRIDDFHPINYL